MASLDDVPGDALPWLLGVARRVLANRRRSENRGVALRARIRSEQSAGGGVIATPDADSPALRALWSLSERDQEVLMLAAWDGLDRGQAAAVLGISSGTHRAASPRPSATGHGACEASGAD